MVVTDGVTRDDEAEEEEERVVVSLCTEVVVRTVLDVRNDRFEGINASKIIFRNVTI